MIYIAIFILGVICGVIGIPFITSIAEYIYLKYDLIKSTMNIKIVTNNVKIEKIKETLEKTQTHAMGFQIPDESNDDDYDDEDDFPEEDKSKSNSTKKVGFCRW